MPNFATDGTIGANFYRTRESAFFNPDFALGRSVPATGGTRYVYVKAVNAIASGGYATVDSASLAYASASAGGDYVADTAFKAGDYGWLRRAAGEAAVYSSPGSNAPLIAYFGDSIPASFSSQDTALVTAHYVYSPATWVQMLMKHGVRTRSDLIFATAGHTTANSLARVDEVIASDADVVVVNCVTNDLGNISASQTKQNLNDIWDRLTAAGKVVISIPILSRGLDTQATRDAMYELMDWHRRQRFSNRRNFYVADPNLEWADPASASGDPKTYLSYDRLHPRGKGNYFYAKPIAAILSLLYPQPFNPGMTSVADVWSADNPSGNLLPGGMMSGAPAISGSGGPSFSGTMPDNVTISASAGSGGTITSITVAGAAVTMGDGTGGYQITIGGTGTGSSASPGTCVLITQTVTSLASKLAIGDVLEGAVHRVECDAGAVNIAGVRLRLRSTEGSVYDRYDAWDTIADEIPPEAANWSLRTPTRTLSAVPSALTLAVWISFRNQSAASFTGVIRIGRMTLRKVI